MTTPQTVVRVLASEFHGVSRIPDAGPFGFAQGGFFDCVWPEGRPNFARNDVFMMTVIIGYVLDIRG